MYPSGLINEGKTYKENQLFCSRDTTNLLVWWTSTIKTRTFKIVRPGCSYTKTHLKVTCFEIYHLFTILLMKVKECIVYAVTKQTGWKPETTTVTMTSRRSTKHNSPSIVWKTVEEHILDSSREWSIVLPLHLKRQDRSKKGHERQFKRSQMVSMATRHFEQLPWLFESDVKTTFVPELKLRRHHTIINLSGTS